MSGEYWGYSSVSSLRKRNLSLLIWIMFGWQSNNWKHHGSSHLKNVPHAQDGVKVILIVHMTFMWHMTIWRVTVWIPWEMTFTAGNRRFWNIPYNHLMSPYINIKGKMIKNVKKKESMHTYLTHVCRHR